MNAPYSQEDTRWRQEAFARMGCEARGLSESSSEAGRQRIQDLSVDASVSDSR